MEDKITIYLNNQETEISKDLTLNDVALQYNQKEYPVIAFKVNNEIAKYNDKVKDKSHIEFLYANDLDGNKIYKSALKFILITAVYDLYGKNSRIYFEHSIDKGICFTIDVPNVLENSELPKIKEAVDKVIADNLEIKRINVSKKNAMEYYHSVGENEKAYNIQNILDAVITLYQLKDNYNYFYTDMPFSTGVIHNYDIIYIGNNKFVLLFPVIGKDMVVPTYHHYPLNMKSFSDYKEWIRSLGILNVSDINNLVSHNKIESFVRTNELYLQKNILQEAENIFTKGNIKLVLMAGPSSSGKTTTCKKLALALQTYGLNILNLSIDDYYLDHKDMPEEAVKNHDFESIDLIDMDLLNDNLEKLVNLKEVYLPSYDFTTGSKEFATTSTSINENTIILLEGNHALNPKLLRNINDNEVYRIYISPFCPLEIDRHNHLSTLDVRLIRRIVRDNQFRNSRVEKTLEMWELVRKGEEEYIFPYMQNVDSVLNTSLVYEVGVLKVYAEPLLYSVPVTSPLYEEAKRLIDFLKIFHPIPSEYVEKSSLLREFIGGSIFK